VGPLSTGVNILMMNIKLVRHLAALVVAVSVSVTGTMAWAANTSGNFSTLTSTGVSFSSGHWQFQSGYIGSTNFTNAIWNYSGYLNDTLDDGNHVYTQGRVDGYGFSQAFYYNGGANTGTYQSINIGPQADPLSQGQMTACRDRGALFPNNCVQFLWTFS
jgi:hypothetical protein